MGETIQEFAIISCGTIMKIFVPLLQKGEEDTGHGHHLVDLFAVTYQLIEQHYDPTKESRKAISTQKL